MDEKFLSANTLKYIAVIAMTIDHVAFTFVPHESPVYFVMRLFGRLTAPIMSFFIVEGFLHTKNYRKYFLRMFVFGIISQPFYFVMIFRHTPKNIAEFFMNLNVMFNFCISLILLKIVSGKLRTEKKIFLSRMCVMFSDLCDWSIMIPAWVLIFFFFRNSKFRTGLFISVSVVLITLKFLPMYNSFTEFSYQYGVLMTTVLISLYNGRRSQRFRKFNRWFFYVYYPLHIAVIDILLILI